MPRISVVVPVYNAARYLCECLDSVLDQTFTDWEVVAVDDGSTDSSGEILDRYAKKDARIRVIHKKNGRVWAARNDALEIVRGEWVSFLDSDDLLAPHWLAEAMKADSDGVDLIHQQLFAGFEIPADFKAVPLVNKFQVFAGRDAAVWSWSTLPQKGFPVLCFVRRSIIQDIRFRPVIDCKEDSVWLLELSPRMKKVCETGYRGYFYRMTPNSLSRSGKRTAQCAAYLEALGLLWESQREWRRQFDLDRLVSKELRICADYDVIEWISSSNHPSRDDVKKVRRAYFALVKSEGFIDRWRGELRYGIVFRLWRWTGWMWPIFIVKSTFLMLRRVINFLKGKVRGNA